ncbi:UDP-3-O-(3-hydroxymyristoyl)glucosamine N-acyltransferase [Sulfitobacter alexandrii]|uniref:UDP-3-O-(3-hydroxymyristoyl)glucosamine N-acyltransferase n=1 Tax=Sulfitobacter alexandrii TaxID=1917485 RepID=A0A1J0WGL5_9RHOB|nr:UDP-3-O-(3-hydroxymyristoyl)glucosamine N-acyltransferase [Sulfitobacter alexandrii]APE43450.1 UDP-3-O-(3-hydroxymyristoyl)glucosamine N-acyltransferase [Sulfitobacter alexandrii]
MGHTVREIADSIGARAEGDLDLVIRRASEPASAGPDDLAMASTPKYAGMLSQGQARVAMLWPGADWQSLGLRAAILPERPRFAMSGLTRMLDPGQGFAAGIHPSAVIDDSAELGEGVSVGPLAVISAGARIGANSVIGPQCFIGMDAVLGPDCFLREMVSIGARVQIGARFIAQPGARIGGDGFSFVTPEAGAVEHARKTLGDQGTARPQSWARIHSLGAVTIGDDVEIGMNTTVDSGTIRDTRIGNGTKLDCQIQIGHNVVVGNDTLICAQVGIAGSSVIGNNVVLGGQSGISDNIFVGDRVILGAGTKALSNVPAGRTMLGYPATQMENQLEIYKALRRLPRLLREVASLRKVVSKSDGDD